MPDDGLGNGVDTLQNLLRGFRVLDFQAECFVERHDDLQGVHRIQPDAAGAEQRLLVANLLRRELQHEVFNEQFFDFEFECRRDFHGLNVQSLSDLSGWRQA